MKKDAADRRAETESGAVIGEEQSRLIAKKEDSTANPAPLGLMAFGLTTVLLNLHNAGYFALNSVILAMALFYGGIVQLLCGVLEWRKNNIFGMIAFLSYGSFWLSFFGIATLPSLGIGAEVDNASLAAYLLVWGIFTSGMFVASLKLNRAIQFVLASLAFLYFLLAVGAASGNLMITRTAGFVGIVVGFSAVYTSFALMLNEVYGRTVIPIWPVVERKSRPTPRVSPESA